MNIPTLFEKVFTKNGKLKVHNKINKKCKWMYDDDYTIYLLIKGLDVLVIDGVIHKKRRISENSVAPVDWIREIGLYPSNKKDKIAGWYPIHNTSDDKYFLEAHINWLKLRGIQLPDGYFKLIGPKINNNMYNIKHHYFVCPYTHNIMYKIPILFDRLSAYLYNNNIEGLIFVNSKDYEKNNGDITFARQAKIEKDDF